MDLIRIATLGLVLLAASLATTDAAVVTVTVTSTTTTTSTSTSFFQTSTICASLVNATSACRRKKFVWIDRPLIIAMDDDVHDQVAKLYASPVAKPMMTTPLPVMESRNAMDAAEAASAPDVIQPSMGYRPDIYNSRVAEPLFQQWLAFLNFIRTTTSTTTVMNTQTATTTFTSTLTTTTKSFFVSSCIPPNLGYSICPASG